jgi:uncharacterized surface protein with fasciclin (FAS1) repeats
MIRLRLAIAAAFALPLAACDTAADQTETAGEVSADAFGEALEDAEGMKTVSGALAGSGLAGIFDGAGSYTLIAPNDAAFEKLGETGKALMAPEQKAAMAAVLKEHIVPGYLTPADIEAAVNAANGQPVKMRTMGVGELSFAKGSGGIVVTAADGATATFRDGEVKGKNAIAIPVDGVLKKV